MGAMTKLGKAIKKIFARPTAEQPKTRAQTNRYRSNLYFQHPRDLPPFTFETIRVMLQDPALKLNLAMRSAPIAAVEFAYIDGVGADGKPKWTKGVRARNPVVAAWVQRQLDTIWANYLPGILSSQKWGWAGGEVTLKLTDAGLIEIDTLLPRHAKDIRLLELPSTGDYWGIQIQNVKDVGRIDIPFTHCYFVNFRPEDGDKYSASILLGAYSPWADKWLSGGALDTRRLYMHKDAYGGMRIGYPDDDLFVDGNPNPVPARDIAMQIAEQRQSGGTITYPSIHDEHGPKWIIEESTVGGNPQHILQYPKDLDDEMRQGCEIPDGAINNDGSGAWEGKALPLAAMYAGLDTWVSQIISDLRRTLDALILLNFGKEEEYSITHKPLALQAMEQQGEKHQGGPMDEQQGQYQKDQSDIYRMSLSPRSDQEQQPASSEAIAKELRRQSRNRAAVRSALRKMSTMQGSKTEFCDELQLKPQREYSYAFLTLPADLSNECIALAQSIHPDDLHENGIETEPHITVKFGLHSDSMTDEVVEIARNATPLTIRLGDASTFENAEYDVVKIDIISDELEALNKELSKLPCTDSYPQYLPHLTLAYVKPGLGSLYAERLNAMKGRTVVVDRLSFSDKNSATTSTPFGLSESSTPKEAQAS